jgi:hypothetical protein
VGETEALELRRCVVEATLDAANTHRESFKKCQQLWEDLLPLGFSNIESQCSETMTFADCCRYHGQVEMGLSVLDPLIAEIKRLRAQPDVTRPAARYYKWEIQRLEKIRAEIEARRTRA